MNPLHFLKALPVACLAGLPYMASAKETIGEHNNPITVSAEEEAGEHNERGLKACHENVTCYSGWPGTRGCYVRIFSEWDIVPDSIEVEIDGHNGEVGHSAIQVGPREIDFTASIHEGNAFGPGDNTTKYTVTWLCSRP